MKSTRGFKAILSPLVALSLIASSAYAGLLGPYTPDANTLHLWHLDEAATPCVDSAVGGTNLTSLFGGATLNTASFTGYGTALNTRDLGQADITAAGRDAYLACRALANAATDNTAMNVADPVTGAFTIEALVRIDFNPALNLGTAVNGGNGRGQTLQILSAEDEGSGARLFQLRIAVIGTLGVNLPTQPALEFINVRQGMSGQVQTLSALIPTNGVDAIISNGWYHVAVTYNGNENTADNLKLYWTAMDGTKTNANQLLSGSMVNDMSVGAPDFCLGNIGRSTSQSSYLGSIDEVRISKIARAETAMQFVPPLSVLENPSNQVVALSQPATFNAQAVGLPPLGYQWRHYGTNLPGATGASYTIPSTTLADGGPYDVVVTNVVNNPVTSLVATLTLYLPQPLTWAGTGGDWDPTTANWTTNANTTQTIYNDLDAVTFDSLGSAQPNVNLTDTRKPFSVTVNASTDYAFNGFGIAGLGSLTKSGAGKLTLNVSNSYSGPTTINAGTVQLENSGGIGTGPVTNLGSIVVNTFANAAFPGAMAGSGNLTIQAGTASLSGENTYTGPTVISGGTLYTQHGSALGAVSSGTSVSNGAQLFINFNVDLGAEPLLLNGSGPATDGALRKGGAGSSIFGGPITLESDAMIRVDGGATLRLTNAAGITGPNLNLTLASDPGGIGFVTGPVTLGSGSLTKNLSGSWVLASTANAWTGGTIINLGTLQIGDGITDGSLPTQATPILVNGTIAFNGVNPQTYPHEFTGIGAVTKVGTNTVTLTGTNTYSGATTVSAGTLIPGNASAFGDLVGTTTISGGSALSRVGLVGGLTMPESFVLGGRQPFPDLAGLAGHIVNLSDTNTLTGQISGIAGGNQYNIESAAGLLIVAGNYAQGAGTGDRLLNLQGDGPADWTGTIANGTANVLLFKRGAGTWTLSGANTYSGATSVSNGTLIVNGSIGQGVAGNAVSVYGGTLGGNGIVNAPVTVLAGGNLAPGGSIGLLTVGTSLTLASGSTTSVELNKTAGTNDTIAVGTTATYGGTLIVTNLSGTIAVNDSFTLFTAASHVGNFSSISGSPGAGLSWSFANGVLTAISVASTPTNISYSLSGNSLTLSWPGSHLGWILQSQTNGLNVGISNNWIDVAGSGSSTQSVITVNPAVPTMFFRLRNP